MYSFCIGDLGLSIGEIRSLTVYELNHRMLGYNRAERNRWQHTASLMAAILQPHSKKSVRVQDFVPNQFRAVAPKMSAERIEKDVARKLRAYKKAYGNDS